MSLAKLALRALSYVGPPVADWLARKLSTTQNAEEKARIAESNRHATQSGAARDASSDATERMMRCEHEWQPKRGAVASEQCLLCGQWRVEPGYPRRVEPDSALD